jgi:hypothetical protein
VIVVVTLLLNPTRSHSDLLTGAFECEDRCFLNRIRILVLMLSEKLTWLCQLLEMYDYSVFETLIRSGQCARRSSSLILQSMLVIVLIGHWSVTWHTMKCFDLCWTSQNNHMSPGCMITECVAMDNTTGLPTFWKTCLIWWLTFTFFFLLTFFFFKK